MPCAPPIYPFLHPPKSLETIDLFTLSSLLLGRSQLVPSVPAVGGTRPRVPAPALPPSPPLLERHLRDRSQGPWPCRFILEHLSPPACYLIFLFIRFIVYLPTARTSAPREQEFLSVLFTAGSPAPGTVPSP